MKKKTADDEEGRQVLPASFLTGVVALVFLAIGYQTALFIHRAATLHILAGRDAPDTVYVYRDRPVSSGPASAVPGASAAREVRREAPHAEKVRAVRAHYPPRRTASFPFNPNTVSEEDLQRLGFSPAQAAAIDRYRSKGGRFHRKEDFAKSYVVADSVYRRLEPFIVIPKLDLNRADSAAFETLPGIGAYFSSRMVSYRHRLGGYSCKEQLLEIDRFGEERYAGLEDLVEVSAPPAFPLWTLPEDSLSLHPHIGRHASHGIVLFRENTPRAQWSVQALEAAGILTGEQARRLSRCRIAEP